MQTKTNKQQKRKLAKVFNAVELPMIGRMPNLQTTETVFMYFVHCLSQWEFLPREIRVAFPKESQLQQSRATQPSLIKAQAGSFRVSIIHRTLTCTTGALTCVRDPSYACVYTRGVMVDTPTAKRVCTTCFTRKEKNSHKLFLCS